MNSVLIFTQYDKIDTGRLSYGIGVYCNFSGSINCHKILWI